MKLKALVGGLAAASLGFVGTAFAQPVQLSSAQMDAVTAGFLEVDTSNTSQSIISIFQRPYLLDPTPNTISCSGCYLAILNPTFSVTSQILP